MIEIKGALKISWKSRQNGSFWAFSYFSFPTSILLNKMVLVNSNIMKHPEWLHQFAFPPTVQEGSRFSISSSASIVSWFVHFGHSDWCEVISECGFDLYFPDEERRWASFHVPVGHPDVFFRKVPLNLLCESFYHEWMLYFVKCFFFLLI